MAFEVHEHPSPRAFAEAAGPLLLRDPARNGLMLSIVRGLERNPRAYDSFHLWVASRDGVPVGAATVTPPMNLLVARPADLGAIAGLARAIHAGGTDLPGVNGGLEEAGAFARTWRALTGRRPETRMRLRLYDLETVEPLPNVPGELRPARPDERPLMLEWWSAFAVEAGLHDDPVQHERAVDGRMALPLGLVVWAVDGRPVCVAGSMPSPPSAARIGPVYTPPDLRRHGYGTALTAELTRRLLASGCDRCMLYTDLANPTSNAIYGRIGYRPVCDSVEIAFQPAG